MEPGREYEVGDFVNVGGIGTGLIVETYQTTALVSLTEGGHAQPDYITLTLIKAVG